MLRAILRLPRLHSISILHDDILIYNYFIGYIDYQHKRFCNELCLTVKATPGRTPPPLAPTPTFPDVSPGAPPPVLLPPIVPPAVGGAVPWGTKVGKGGGAAAIRATATAAAAAAGLCRNSSNTSSTEIH